MARSTDPLQREALGVAAQLPGARLVAPRTNAALQLADALKEASPEAQALMQGVAQEEAKKAAIRAKQDALRAEGQPLADAVREGRIDATQNPWYIEAYKRESSVLRSMDSLQKLQTDSASWDTYNDPEKFASQWRDEVGKLAEGFTDTESMEGFQAAQGQVTSQVLQENVQRNIARIKEERVQNLGALTADSLQSVYRTNGGHLSPNQAAAALQASAQQWFATGGSEGDWHQLLVKSVTNLAYAAQDSSLLDLLKAPELIHGPSAAGDAVAGVGAGDTSNFNPPVVAPHPTEPGKLTVTAPATKLAPWPVPAAHISSEFGARKAPKAGASTYHRGMDIAVPVGTPVTAQAVGRVVSARDEGKLGTTVRVDYGGGVVAIYGHLNSASVKEGDIVHPGQQLASSGNTGNSTGPHLHYQLMVNGKATNPRAFNGQVGGTFEAQASEQAPAYPGFPNGKDQPFSADGVVPGNVLNRGPSLYGMPGVADQVESDRYRINEAAAAAPLQRARVIKAQREARGYEATDILWQKYGTGLLTGAATRSQITETLAQQGYSGPEIAEALQQVNSVLRDSVGVANAQVAARQQQPGTAMDILQIVSDAQRTGWTPGLERRVGDHVLNGTLSGDDAQHIISGAVSRQNSNEAEARAQQRFDDQQAKENGGIRNYSDLRQRAGFLRDLVVNTVATQLPAKANQIRSPKVSKAILDRITSVMGAWLSANPEDYSGALQAGKDAANKSILETMGQFPRAPSAPAAGASGGNPRRQ